MRKFLRRLRGVIGTGLTWAVGWAGVKVGLMLLAGVPLQFLGMIALPGLIQGFMAGGAFATVLAVAERRNTLEDLSLRRVALWGGLGGMVVFLPLIPFVLSQSIPFFPVLGSLAADALLGAGLATGSVALAKKADPMLSRRGDDRMLLLEED